MNGVDLVAVIAAGLASVCLGLRAYMLKPTFGSWCTAPGLVWASLLVLSVACAISALSILRGGGHATAREALVLLALAGSSAVMLRNLHRQTPVSAPAGVSASASASDSADKGARRHAA